MPRKRNEFDAGSVAIRFAIALLLVFATYNPSGWSYVHWAIVPLPAFDPYKAIAGIVLAIGYTMFIRATARSLGIFGISLAIAFFGVLIWLIVDVGILPDISISAESTLVINY